MNQMRHVLLLKLFWELDGDTHVWSQIIKVLHRKGMEDINLEMRLLIYIFMH